MPKDQVPIGWASWMLNSAAQSAVGTAASAGTDTFLRTLVNPVITGTSFLVGCAASLVFQGAVNVTCWGAGEASRQVVSLFQIQPHNTPLLIEDKSKKI